MVTYHPSNSIYRSSGVGQSLPAANDLIVDRGIAITSADDNGVYGFGSNTITCDGVIGGTTAAFLGRSSTLSVGVYGTISGADTGVFANGGTSIVNKGTIFGGFTGVWLQDGTTVTNTGTIRSGEHGDGCTAVYMTGNTDPIKLVNSGTIETQRLGDYAIRSNTSGERPETVTNNGTIEGLVSLAGGNDIFINTAGKVVNQDGKTAALIDGGSGADRFYLGASVEKLNGGIGADMFYFKSKPNSGAVDHILDFAHGSDRILLYNSLFPLGSGNDIAHAFHDVTTQAVQADDRILYNHDTGALSYDADGSGSTKAVLFAVLDNHPVINYHDLVMV